MEVREEPTPATLIQKAWKVINSCETHKHAQGAIKYLDLLGDTYPDLDLKPLRDELAVLFDLEEGWI